MFSTRFSPITARPIRPRSAVAEAIGGSSQGNRAARGRDSGSRAEARGIVDGAAGTGQAGAFRHRQMGIMKVGEGRGSFHRFTRFTTPPWNDIRVRLARRAGISPTGL